MIDAKLITRKLNLIIKDLGELETYGCMTLDAYLASPVNEAAVERYLERVIGRMIDVNYHLITELGHAPPAEYHASFTELARLRVLPREFAAAIARAAGLRNRIVHEYDALDERKVFEAVKDVLRDVPRYVEHVHGFVQASGPPEGEKA